MTRKKGMMTVDTFERILSEMESFKPGLSLHLAGESFLHKNLFGYIKQAKHLGFYVRITTNGTLLKENDYGILDSGIDYINISLSGADFEDYKLIHNTDNFYDIKNNIINLAKKKIEKNLNTNIYVNFVSTHNNKTQLIKIKNMFESIPGINGVIIRDLINWSGGIDIRKSNLHYSGIRQICGRLILSNIVFLALYRLLIQRKSWNEFWNAPWCPSINNSAGILWDGSVVPCCFDYNGELAMGNINEKRFLEIWNGPKMNKLRIMVKSRKSTFHHPVCGPCRFGTL